MAAMRSSNIYIMSEETLLILIIISTTIWPASVVGNLPPNFVKDMNLEVISEDTPIGTSIYQLKGEDPERGPVTYSLQGTSQLVVDAKTGVVTVAKPLDYEETQILKFRVGIEDQVDNGRDNNRVEIPVAVMILDANDNSPVFQDEFVDISISENTTVGTTILQWINMTDEDSIGENLTVTCTPTPQFPDVCNIFEVVSIESTGTTYSGHLILKENLNYEEQKFYYLLLNGSDGKYNVTATVTLRIQDIQNKPPIFTSSLIGNISESVPTGTTVMTLQAKDGDVENQRQLIYELISNPGNLFSIDAKTGEIQTALTLDREAMTSSVITLKVKVTEIQDGAPVDDRLASSMGDVYITVQDINDTPPKFNINETEVNCFENSPDGTPLQDLNLFVMDPDVSAKSELHVNLIDYSGFFNLHPTMINGSSPLQIRIQNGPLDYENPNHRKFILLLVATEKSTSERLSTTATLTVNILDVNDNFPQFNEPKYITSVMESAPPGTTIGKITATDKDNGNYGTSGIRYQISGVGSEKFKVNEITGEISTATPPPHYSDAWIDYETKEFYHLTYQARDELNKGLLSVVPLKINVIDADDNPPMFTKRVYIGMINEADTEFTPHLILKAEDKDESSVLQYKILDGNINQLFAIDPFTGELRATNASGLYLGSLKRKTFNLTVQVTDSADNVDNATVLITVQDINSDKPVFDSTIYSATVMENASPDTFVIQVYAEDLDSRDNSSVIYRVSRGARNNFIVNETTGIITVSPTSHFDYDKRPRYNVEILGIDKGNPPRTSTTTVMISITNINDKPPEFIPKIQRTQVYEDAKVGDVVYALNATDSDATSPSFLKFSVLEQLKIVNSLGEYMEIPLNISTDQAFFGVDHDNGKVTVIKELLQEEQIEVVLKVRVVDTSANPPQTGEGTLIISVIDVNDDPPTFPAPWSAENPTIAISVLEEQPVGAIVYTFVAIDDDSSIDGYAIIPDDTFFEIDAVSGIVTTKSRIDYESMQEINFMVAAFDSGIPQLSATALVTASIINVNDNDPVFSQTEYFASIKEHSPLGTFVTEVKAEDKDLGEFGSVSYKLIGDYSILFTIDEGGKIQVGPGAILDRENISLITIHVVASDDAPEEMAKTSVSVPVYITILDINDHSPKFTEEEYNVSVMDSVLIFPPTPILQLSATDSDEGLNAQIHYKIVEGNDEGIFTINSQTGVLFPATLLVGRSKHHKLKVEARDVNGTGPNFAQTTVNIEIQQVNGNAPRIVTPMHRNSTIYVFENSEPNGNILCTIHAEDPDQGANGRIRYFIKDDERNLIHTDLFSINSDNGQLTLNKPLNREETAKYTLVIAVQDEGIPQPFETLQQLTIMVKDVNDNEPYFPNTLFTNPYSFKVEENLQVGALVGHLEAIDEDSDENAVIYYFLIGATDDKVFAVDKLTGSIYSNQSLDFEKKQQYELHIKATNNASYVPQKINIKNDTSIAIVKVHVVDVNDNVPVFPQAAYYAGISSNAKIGEIVAKVTAFDPDQEDNGTLIYSLEKTTLFSLGTRTSARILEKPPFVINKDGAVLTDGAMNIYLHDHFRCIIQCQERNPPSRSATSTLDAWVYDNEQLSKITISLSMRTAPSAEIMARILSEASKGVAIVTESRRFFPQRSKPDTEWYELIFLVVDPEKRVVKSIPETLSDISSNGEASLYKNDHFKIMDIGPLIVPHRSAGFDPVLIALIALCLTLLLGFIIVIIVIQCLKRWYKNRKIVVVKKRELIEPPITTENPLWIDSDAPVWADPTSKIYEEQELSMQVSPGEQEIQQKKESQPEAMYATVRRSAKSVRDNIRAMEAHDGYATLNQQGLDDATNDRNATLTRSQPEYEMHPKSISTLDRPFTNGITDDEDFPPLPPTVTSVPSIPQFYDHTESSEDPFTATEVL